MTDNLVRQVDLINLNQMGIQVKEGAVLRLQIEKDSSTAYKRLKITAITRCVGLISNAQIHGCFTSLTQIYSIGVPQTSLSALAAILEFILLTKIARFVSVYVLNI